ncbi:MULTISPECIES: J domain-containing protein [Pontibacillus]|uniref:DnaJ domain-containing protein n=1 Tax=Pontibacillus chungwhensis TaxID=265426 RepID=A0ABY8UZ10_9BACI|nr:MULTISPECIES: DnaJ domain-containing protein [Pontibacillus]MCD5324157.1 DnaJ domain-containing protein [Pontibacillus sp. HN14]WIF97784.1 DnaJ domain-containing protein [Pontibacillus chungwhensis]
MAQDYYDILEVSKDATQDDIKRAYIKGLRKYSNETHPEEFKLIREAYEVLYNADKREKYDQRSQQDTYYEDQMEIVLNYMEHSNFKDALKILLRLENRYSNDVFLLQQKAICLIHLKRFREAKIIAQSLLGKDPNNIDTLIIMGTVYENLEAFPMAVPIFKKLIDLQPDEAGFRHRLSFAYSEQNDYRSALDVLEEYIYGRSTHGVDAVPLLVEMIYLNILLDQKPDHDDVVDILGDLFLHSPNERTAAINIVMNHATNIGSEHYVFKDLISTVELMNRGKDPEVNDWLNASYESLNHNLIYYPQKEKTPSYSKVKKEGTPSYNNAQRERNSSYDQAHRDETASTYAADLSTPDEYGSIVISILIGLFFTATYNVVSGFILGFMWYLFAPKIKSLIKTILNFVGCLLLILVVIAFLFGFG